MELYNHTGNLGPMGTVWAPVRRPERGGAAAF